MTLTLFNKMYKHYKDDWDLEMSLRRANMTYEEAYNKSQKDQSWLG